MGSGVSLSLIPKGWTESRGWKLQGTWFLARLTTQICSLSPLYLLDLPLYLVSALPFMFCVTLSKSFVASLILDHLIFQMRIKITNLIQLLGGSNESLSVGRK